MKEFKNIPSKLYEKTENWIVKEKNLTKTKYSNNYRQIKLIQEQNRLKKQKQDIYVARK